MSKYIWIILAAGLILRLILSSFTFHPDIQVFDLAGQILKGGHLLNFYDYLYTLPLDDQIIKNFPPFSLNYPPLTYILLGGSSLIFTAITPTQIHSDFLFNTRNILGNMFLFLHLLALKLPLLFFDLGCAVLLFKFFDDFKTKLLAFTIWMFNPLTLYATFMMGQYDIIPTFFTIASLYMVKGGKESGLRNIYLAAILLGIGAAFKIYPFLFLIPLASLTKSFYVRSKIIALGLAPYLLTIFPFLPSFGFRSNALLANQLSKSFYPQIPVSGGESIILFLAALTFFYLIFLKISDQKNLWQYYFVVILLFFIFTHAHPQWFLWLTPFLIIEVIVGRFRNILATTTAFFSWFMLLFFFDQSLTIGLFAPINPQVYQGKDLWQLMGISLDINFFRSILHTLFVGAAFYFTYRYFPKKLSTVSS